MMRNILFTLCLFALLACFGFMHVSQTVGASAIYLADSKTLTCDGATFVEGGSCDPQTDTSVTDLAKMITSIFAWALGTLSVLFIVYGGFKYVTGGSRLGGEGVTSGAASAKNTIIYAALGLVVALLAQPLVSFAIGFFIDIQ